MRIKKVDPAHQDVRDAITGMHRVCFPDFDLQQLHGDWWVVFDGEYEPVAFASLWPSITTPGGGYLSRSGVLPSARGQGLQRRLIRAREREAKKKGYVVLLSDTDPLNPHSMNNLVECGFRAFTPKTPWCISDPWVYWRKIIDDGVA